MSEEKIQLTVSGILEDLDNGLSRMEIRKKYGLTSTDVKTLFEHPKLKGKKAKKVYEPKFELVDDTSEAETSGEEQEEGEEVVAEVNEENDPYAD